MPKEPDGGHGGILFQMLLACCECCYSNSRGRALSGMHRLPLEATKSEGSSASLFAWGG